MAAATTAPAHLLWVDKHRPAALEKLDYHQDLSSQLKNMASSADIPHLLFFGPSGAGKKTRIMAILKEIYGPGVEKLKIDLRTFVTPSNRKLDIHVIMSNYHIELTPSDLGAYDRIVIQDLIKEIAQTQQVDTSARRPFKVVVINEAEHLSRDAQAALRRTMEKYMSNLRIILCATSTSRIIPPIRSRCLLVRVASPTIDEMTAVLAKIAKKESIELPQIFARRLAEAADGNLRKAILMFEAARVRKYPFSDRDEVVKTDWEAFIAEMARYIVQEQSPKRLLEVRGKLYELLTHCITADTILKTLTAELVKNVDEGIVKDVMLLAAEYEHSMRLGNKAIFHLEAFVAKFMSVYKKYLFSMADL
ncbi:Replication factor C (RF-C) subunit [Dinochytrium kinnereticum]|nr:Replication factor C (RF-C) subunit [Dinochytrium kinnereticum]